MKNTLKRYGLFLLTNIAIIIMINVILRLLETQFGIQITGWSYTWLLIFAFIFGFFGAIINLFISKWMAKKAYKIVTIDSQQAAQDPKLGIVYDTVQQIANQEGITAPEVGYYRSATPNAFATGASKNNSLVAVSTWLLDNLSDNEVAAVVWHEMAHILNGDMVTMTLLQWILNTFVIFFARVIAMAISAATRDDNGGGLGGMSYFLVVMLLDTVLSILAAIILMFYSRQREYHADAGSANLRNDKASMISALQRLETINSWQKMKQDAFAMLKISWGKTRLNLFRSHPTVEQRVEKLESLQLG